MKETAIKRCFLNGRSHHFSCVFKATVNGKAIRLWRLNEKTSDFHVSLNLLKERLPASEFPAKMTNDMINIQQNWTEKFHPPNISEKNENKTTWATFFPSLIKLGSQKS